MPLKGNSGVGLRAPLKGHPAWVALEVHLIDDVNWGAKLEKWQNTGSIYDVIPASKVNARPIGAWNSLKITAKGRKIAVEQNGANLVDADLDDYAKEHLKKHPGLLRDQGHIGFPSYKMRVEFRNIHLKDLAK